MIEVNAEDEMLVFYSGGRIDDAKAFIEKNPEYFYFDDIFDEDFQEDFVGANLGNEDVAKACSKAMGWHAKGETRVLGDKDASSDSTWVMTEKPTLMSNERVTKIWSMKDSTTDPADHPDGDLKNPSGSKQPESPPPAATKAMQVFWSEVSDGVSPLAWYWQIFVGEAGKGVDPCTGTPINNIYDFSAPSSQNPDQTFGTNLQPQFLEGGKSRWRIWTVPSSKIDWSVQVKPFLVPPIPGLSMIAPHSTCLAKQSCIATGNTKSSL